MKKLTNLLAGLVVALLIATCAFAATPVGTTANTATANLALTTISNTLTVDLANNLGNTVNNTTAPANVNKDTLDQKITASANQLGGKPITGGTSKLPNQAFNGAGATNSYQILVN